MRTVLIGVLVLVLCAGCGQEAAQTGGGGVAGNTGSGEVVCSPGAPATPPECQAVPEPGPGELVEPRPGTRNPRPVAWRQAEPVGDSSVRVTWTSGVEPCYVLDRVEVEETPEQVTITLFEGSDPAAPPDQACIEIAVDKAVAVELTQPVGDRRIVDGAAG